MEYGRKEGQVIFVVAVLSLGFTTCCKKERDSSLSHKARMSKGDLARGEEKYRNSWTL